MWEDRVPQGDNGAQASGMASTPSDWTRNERLQAVREGRRHLGQQVMEYLLIESRQTSREEAEETFANAVRDLIAPVNVVAAPAPPS